MMQVSEKLTNMIHQENSNLTEKQLLKIKYGIDTILNETAKAMVLFIIFLMLSRIVDYFIIMACMFVLRPFVGGYHAKSNAACYVVTFFFFISITLLASEVTLSMYHKFAILTISETATLLICPVDHPYKPINKKRVRVLFKAISANAILIIGIIGLIATERIADLIYFSISNTIVMAILGHFLYIPYNMQSRKMQT